MNPYKLLGCDETASRADVRERYRFLVRKLHPDKHAQDVSFVYLSTQLDAAYKSIKDLFAYKDAHATGRKRGEGDDRPWVASPPSQRPDRRTVASSSGVSLSSSAPHDTGSDTTSTHARVTTVGHVLRDPWFQQDFCLTDYFGDVPLPDKCQSSRDSEAARRSTPTQRKERRVPSSLAPRGALV